MTTPDTARCQCGRPGKHFDKTVCHACYERARRRNPRPLPPLEDRFFAKVRPTEDPLGCWAWIGAIGAGGEGYGIFSGSPRKRVLAHRWSYEFFRTEIPEGLVIDHLCRNTRCVNPWHMDPVTIAVNSLRGQAPAVLTWREGVCRRGHSMANAIVLLSGPQEGRKNCRQCEHDRWAAKAADPKFRARRAAYERDRKARKAAA